MTESSGNKKQIFSKISEIFVTSSSTDTQNISKTPKNTAVSKSSIIQNAGKLKKDQIKKNQKLDSETVYDKSDSDSETGSDSYSNSESDDESSDISIIKNQDDEDGDGDEDARPDDEENTLSDEEHTLSDEESTESEEKDGIDAEYTEEGPNEKYTEKDTDKDTEINDEDDDCLYYDDLVERDSERQVYEIPRADRMTDPQLTHYEKVRLLGIRAKQIAMGSKVMVKYDNSFGPVELAKYELKHKTTPLVIKRPLPDNTYEIWKVSDLNIDDDDSNMIKQDLESSFASIKRKDLYMIG